MWPGVPDSANPQIYILWLVRSGRVDDWVSLATELGIDPHEQSTPELIIYGYLKSLQEAGLIDLEYEPGERFSLRPRRIKLSDKWPKIQLALNVSLAEMTKLGPSAIISTPYFGKPKPAPGSADLFVLMPFDTQLKPVYEDHIANSARELGLRVARGDDFFTAHSVMSDIWTAIMSAKAVIADCTDRNANVFYEIGLAHAAGKPVILIARSDSDVPFDLRHLRYILYDYTPRGMRIFEKQLTDTLRTVLDDSGKQMKFESVLFMVADEDGASRAQLEREADAVETALRNEKTYLPCSKWYVPDLERALLESDFHASILHIVGHADGPDAIIGSRRLAPPHLTDVFRRGGKNLRCLLLSACFSEEQAAAIATVVRNVVGIHADLGEATTSFTVEFYKSLSAGRSVPDAHEIACNRVRLEGILEDRLPALITTS
jgi:hypothetical protein